MKKNKVKKSEIEKQENIFVIKDDLARQLKNMSNWKGHGWTESINFILRN